ncbi:MAG: cell surface protein SprA, partial [Bacteroidetes bacterium]|nr:cell surface protein SprA [Fibrella sp.]
RYSTRFGNRNPGSPFILRDPKAVKTDVQLDSTGQLAVYERIGQSELLQPFPPTSTTGSPAAPASGTLPYRPAETVPFSSYGQLQNQRAQQSVWREYGARRDGQSAVSGRGLLPKLELPPIVDRLFGGSKIDFKPNGFVTLDFGYLYQFIDNPAIPVRQRRQGNLNFNEQININFNGQIGERLGLLANFDTKASFNFENALKLNYRPTGLLPAVPGLPGAPPVPTAPTAPTFGLANPSVPQFTPQNENILQNIEVGNLSWKLNSQLIPGVQNLFGLKTDLRFGKLNMTVVASQQRSKRTEIVLRGGATNRQYEIRADQYDENRHFFLAQYFRTNYERSLRNLPVITSGITITRLEVYVTNRTNTTETLRNVVGFSDLAENRRFNGSTAVLQPLRTNLPADNAANGLYARLKANENIRQVDRTTEELTGVFNLVKGQDYDLLRGAKRLTEREYRFQPQLGYISLITPLRNDEVLAVSYEYTFNGQRYQVGELTEDYQNRTPDQVLVLKLLKSSTIRNNVQLPQWDLMMKNIYSLNTTQVARQGFQMRIVYKDDLTGIDNPTLQESSLQGRQLVDVFGMDKLNQQLDPQPDGNFDFVEDVTVDSKLGKVIFPTLEPFGSFLSRQFQPNEDQFRSKYVFDILYRSTLSDAFQVTSKNKFFLRGSFQSATGQEVTLPYGVNAASVQVTAGGVPLTAGTDYVLEAQLGKLRLTNEGVTNSGREVRISWEQPDLFQNQIRTLLGTHLDYALNPDVSVGLTAMRLRETPAGFLTRVAIGNEPVNNTILGANATIRKDAPGLTRLIDKLPFLQTKELSTIAFQGEVATLLPGVAPRVNDNSFIDDFEAARTIFDLTRQPTRWRLGSTPQQFPQGSFQN